MDPIVLNENGAKLHFERLSKVVRDLNDKKNLGEVLCGIGCVVGTHVGCWVYLVHESETHRALFCKSCGLRMVIPVEVNTYGKLREWCKIFIEHRGWPYDMRAKMFFDLLRSSCKCCPPENFSLDKPVDLAQGSNEPDQDWGG